MNDGVKMVLERMKTHPEEFYGEESRWSYVMSRYEKFFTQQEKNHLENAITELRRGEFTAKVMEKLLEEPVKLDSEFTIRTTGRDPWGSSTLSIQEQVLADKQRLFEDAYKDEVRKLMQQQLNNQSKAEKNKSKMRQLLQAVTKKKQVY